MGELNFQRTSFSSAGTTSLDGFRESSSRMLVEDARRLLGVEAAWLVHRTPTDALADGAVPAFGFLAERSSRGTQIFDWDDGARSGEGLEVACDPDGRVALLVGLSGLDRPGRADLRARADVLRPLLSDVLGFWRTHLECDRALNEARAALDAKGVATLILDAQGRLVFANSAGTRLLEHGNPVELRHGLLSTKRASDTLRLRVAMEHALAQDGDALSILKLAKVDGCHSMILMVRRLNSASTRNRVMISILDPNIDVCGSMRPICELYGLTKVEAHLATLLCIGRTLAAAAAELGIKEATARSYLKLIFAKTDTHRQTDLTRLMLASMLRSPAMAGAEVL